MEYQAKELFEKVGLRAQKSVVLSDKNNVEETIDRAGLSYPLVLKAQVQVGGRGKAGGIRFAETPEEARHITDNLLFTDLKGFRVNKLMAVEKADIAKEWYLSILLDRDLRAPRILFSNRGGMDIEEVSAKDPEAIIDVPVNPMAGITDYTVRYLCSKGKIGLDFFDKMKDVTAEIRYYFSPDSRFRAGPLRRGR